MTRAADATVSRETDAPPPRRPEPPAEDGATAVPTSVARVGPYPDGDQAEFVAGIRACDFAVHPDGVIDVAVEWEWCACANGGGPPPPAVKAWRFADHIWTNTLSESGKVPPSMAVDASGSIVISKEGSDVRRWNGQGWTSLSAPAGKADEQPSVVFDPTGDLYMVPQSLPEPPRDETVAIRRLRNGMWESLGGPDVGWSWARASAAKTTGVDSPGILYVAHDDPHAHDRISVHRWNGSQWAAVGSIPAAQSIVEGFDLTVGSDGVPYLAVIDPGATALEVLAYRDGAWTRLGEPLGEAGVDQVLEIDPTNSYDHFPGAGRPSLVTTPDGSVYVVCRTKGSGPSPRTMLARWTGMRWEASVIWDSDSDFTKMYQPRLDTTPDGTLFLLYASPRGQFASNDCFIDKFGKPAAR